MRHLLKIGLVLFFPLVPNHAQQVAWELTDTPSGGRIFCLYTLPSGTLIAGAETAGIFRSTNQGLIWHQTLGPDKPWSLVTLLSFASDSSGNQFAGTSGPGVYRSVDDGSTWTLLPGISDEILSLTVAPDNSVYAATFYDGVFRSTDAGTTWSHLNLYFSYWPTPIWLVASDPLGNLYAGPANKGLYRSTDGGSTWTYLSSTNQMTAFSFVAINSSRFILGTSWGIYQSSDTGNTWVSTGSGLGRIEDLTSSPNGKLFAATMNGVYVSSDSGLTWVRSSAGLPPGRVLTVSSDSTGGSLAGSDGHGVFRSTDGGNTWSDASQGITGLTINSISFHPLHGGLAGTTRGVYKATNEGFTWLPSQSGITGFVDRVLFLPDGSAIAGGEALYRSTDGGYTWNQTSNNGQALLISTIAAVNPQRVLAASNYQILVSADSGKTWLTTASTQSRVWSMATSPKGLVLAGTYGDGIYRSTDSGMTWSPSSEGLAYNAIYSILISSDGYIYAGGANGTISRSANDGVSWLGIANLPSAVWSLVEDGAGNAYAGTNHGVFRSTDRGKEWTDIGRPIGWGSRSLAFDSNRYIYTGLIAGGIFRSQSPVDLILPQQSSATNNFPNPFNASTTIQLTLRQPDHIDVVIYDLLGRHIETIASRIFPAGNHMIRWIPNGLPSGIYFYNAKSATFSEFGRMVYIR